MIIDNISNASKYYGINPYIKQAFEAIKELDISALTNDRVEIVKDILYLNTIVDFSKEFDESIWESHQKFIDIHINFEGDERVFYAENNSLKIKEDYNVENDLTIFENGEGKEMFIPKNGFILFFPDEIHKTMVKYNASETIKKVVVKLALL